MTKEEVIKELKTFKIGAKSEFGENALDIAIEALEQEPCENYISREKAKQFLYEKLDIINDDELYDIFSRIIDDMYNELPFVEQEPILNKNRNITFMWKLWKR